MKPRDFIELVERRLPEVFHLGYRVTNSTERAERLTYEVFLRVYHGRARIPAPDQITPWLYKITLHLAEKRHPGDEHMTFELLDDTIRSDPTQVTRTGVLNDPERNLLLWELRQGCLTAVLNCLSLGERSAFVLTVMLGLGTDETVATLGITPAALKVRLSRAKKKIVGYLAPRCEHVHPTNPCHCPSRLGVALRKGFIRTTPGAAVTLRAPDRDRLSPATPLRDVEAIYQHLPVPDVPAGLLARIRREVESGDWDRLEP